MTFHHYTNGHGLLGIIKTESIWATQISALNDTSEYMHAINLHIEYLNTLSEENDEVTSLTRDELHRALQSLEAPSIFVASFSLKRDSLSQWRGYGDSGFGYSIDFNANKLGAVLRSHHKDLHVRPCTYASNTNTSTKEGVDRIVGYARQHHVPRTPLPVGMEHPKMDYRRPVSMHAYETIRRILTEAAYFKHPAFAEEEEWRLVAKPDQNLGPTLFRAGKSIIVPYLAIALNFELNLGLIESITLGPTPNMKEAYRSIEALVAQSKDKNIKVLKSEAPYRSW